MAHSNEILYNAAQVILKDPTLGPLLARVDPQAHAQLSEGVRTFDEENAPNVEYVVDLYVPFTTVVPGADSPEMAARMAQDVFADEELYSRMAALLTDTVFTMSDSEWRTEVGEA